MTLGDYLRRIEETTLSVPAGWTTDKAWRTDRYLYVKTAAESRVLVTISGEVLQELVRRAFRNTSRRATSGGITVRQLDRTPVVTMDHLGQLVEEAR